MESDVSAKAAGPMESVEQSKAATSEVERLRDQLSSIVAESKLNEASKLTVGGSSHNHNIAAAAHSHSISNPQWGGSGGIVTTSPHIISTNTPGGYTISSTGGLSGSGVAALPSLTAVTVDGTLHTPKEILEKAKDRLVEAASEMKQRLIELEQRYNDLDRDYSNMQDDVKAIEDAISKLGTVDAPEVDVDDMVDLF